MAHDIDERARDLAVYILEHRATVRSAAKHFGISKSTVHKDVAERLRRVSPALWAQVRAVLLENKAQRHLRGGEATRQKYLQRHKSRDQP
ncbi:MAG: stage III sporulation protein D [Ruminococcaceae bacterium]|jgi:Stage III sporulation protein D.|nr:stage III sporulation protein D [Oscillospiraceae bacterium]